MHGTKISFGSSLGCTRARRPLLALASAALLCGASVGAQTLTETVLHHFTAHPGDGATVFSSVTLGSDGALYGTTWGGGGMGTVFKVNPGTTGFVVLHAFGGPNDGSSPYSSLVQGQDGVLYGTTFWGGVSNAGTVFRLRTDGSGYATLYSFTNSPDGANPRAGLVQGRDGFLYGTTEFGGANGEGAVFKISTNGNGYTVLHSFTSDFIDGATPFAGVIQGADGLLYGTTDAGGSTLGGTIYRLDTNGGSYAVLHSFVHASDGAWPKAALLQAADGALYGTTSSVGSGQGGTVFKMQTDGSGFRVLHSFTNSPGGSQPEAGLAQGCDGALYGTTAWGGVTNGGVVFKIHTDGSGYAELHQFDWAGPDGSHPRASLAGGINGVFYGTTWGGGLGGFGTVYRLAFSPGLVMGQSGPELRVKVRGVPGQRCRIEASTNLTDWQMVADVVLTNGMADYAAPNAAGSSGLFYRGVIH